MTATDTTANGYGQVQERRRRILTAIDGLIGLVTSLEMRDRADALEILRDRVASDAFKVLVMGEFKRGKSTLINALLGQKVLPAHARPTTATINEVKWGETPRAVLHPRATRGKRREPREVPIEELARHVSVGADDDRQINPYERVEVFFPLPLCREGVEIIDSPGLNDVASREKITKDYLQDVDAIMMVFSAVPLGSRTELEVIDSVLHPLGHDHLFLVVNRINEVDAEERQEVIEFGRKRIGDRTRLGADGVFFVNARGALEARLAGDAVALGETGIPQLERMLERFLARDRGRIKLLAPAREIRHVLAEIRTRDLPDREAMLAQELQELQRRAEEAQEPLAGLQEERQVLLEQLDAGLQRVRQRTSAAALAFYEASSADMPKWAGALKAKTEFKAVSLNRQAKQKLTEEVSVHLEQSLQDALRQWQVKTLRPLLDEELTAVAQELDAKVQQFLAQTDRVRVELAGTDEHRREDGADRVALSQLDESALSQVLAAGGALAMSGPAAGQERSLKGAQDLVQRIVPSVAAGVGAVVIFGPGAIVFSLMAIAGIVSDGVDTTKRKAQIEIGTAAAGELRKVQRERAEAVAAVIEERCNELREQVATGLERQIVRVREQIDTVLAVKRQGETGVAEQRRLLVSARAELDQTNELIGDVLEELAGM